MGRKRAKGKPSFETGESYTLVRVGDTYFIKGKNGVLARAKVTPISDEEAMRLLKTADKGDLHGLESETGIEAV